MPTYKIDDLKTFYAKLQMACVKEMPSIGDDGLLLIETLVRNALRPYSYKEPITVNQRSFISTSVRIDDAVLRNLAHVSRVTGIPQAELVRQGVNAVLLKHERLLAG